jgi:hypothetical protein
MAKELKFTDPSFACIVTLSGPTKALYEKAEPQFNRLKGLKTLGIVSHFSEIAMQTRHQHLVGLMRIFNKLCQQPKNKGLPKKFLWSFWCRLCFGQTGHAALSYDSEKAILLACHLDSAFKDEFRTFLQPVIDKLEPCIVCTKKPCEGKQKDATAGPILFEDLIYKNKWWAVNRWVAARKLIQHHEILGILNQQTIGTNNPIGFSQPEAFKMLVCSECKWNSAIENLGRLDYVVRDIAFAGTLGIHVDIDGLIALVEEDLYDWDLIKTLENYLQDTLYEDYEIQIGSILYQRALADLLIKKKISIETLFGMDSELNLDDNALIKIIQKTKAGAEVFNPDILNSWDTWPIAMYLPPTQVPSIIEKSITKQSTNGHLTGHLHNRATCFKMTQDHTLGLAICHRDLANRPTPYSFVILCQRILLQQYPNVNTEQLNKALFEGLIAKDCDHKILDTIKRLAELQLSTDLLKGAIEVIKTKSNNRLTDENNISVRIGEVDYPLSADPRKLALDTLSFVLSSKSLPHNQALIAYLRQGSLIIWAELLNWQSVYFGNKPSKKVIDFITEAQRLLAINVVNQTPSSQSDFEIYTFLESLKNPSDRISFRMALPNLILLTEEKITENEYDVVSVLLKDDKKVEVWIWGVTTEADIIRKRTNDHVKIQKLKDLLGSRWGGDVRTVENYLYKEGNDICCEIDSVQTKRRINIS